MTSRASLVYNFLLIKHFLNNNNQFLREDHQNLVVRAQRENMFLVYFNPTFAKVLPFRGVVSIVCSVIRHLEY
jgi:hypothetical protein